MRKNQGFTLVELIVVLVILAILAAILMPALIGYIDKAKEKKYINDAKACLDATQACLVELYGKNGAVPEGVAVIPGSPINTDKNGDQDVSATGFADKVFNLVDLPGGERPYCFIIGVGSNCSKHNTYNKKVSEHDKYTVFYAFYKETEDAPNMYFYNNEWTNKNPRFYGSDSTTELFDGYNVVKTGPLKGKRIQYYMISNSTGKGTLDSSDFWTWLKKQN